MKRQTEVRIPKDWEKVTFEFVSRVNVYVPGSLRWVARQQTNGIWGNDWGFCIDNMFACVDIRDMRTADDAFIQQVANQMLAQREKAAQS